MARTAWSRSVGLFAMATFSMASEPAITASSSASVEADRSTWFSGDIDRRESPVDLRFLDPAKPGDHGFLGTYAGHFVFADGTPARFWGATVAGDALFGRDRERMAKQAERLAKLGFNLVRIRHQDASRVHPNLYLDGSPDTQQTNDEALDALDYFIASCIKAGLYVQYDLHDDRSFRAGDDVPGFAEMNDVSRHRDGQGKGYCYFNRRIQDLMKAWQRAFWSHENPYLGRAYRDEPGIALAVISDDNDLTSHYGDLMLADRGNPYHRQLFLDDVQHFSADRPFDADTAARTSEPGPAKLYLNSRESAFFADMHADMRDAGCRIPVAGTTGCAAAWDLPAMADADFLATGGKADDDPLAIDPAHGAGFLARAALARVVGKPFTLAWSQAPRAEGRAIAMLQVAAMARLQDWDAAIVEDYARASFDATPSHATDVLDALDATDARESASDPAALALAPAAALMFRRGDLRVAKRTVGIVLAAERIHAARTGAEELPALRSGIERHRVVVALEHLPEVSGLQEPIEGTGTEDASHAETGATELASDTGEIHRDWLAAWQTIDAPRTVAAQGLIGGRQLAVGTATFAIATRCAVVCLQSLDETPVARSRRLLVSVCARVEADGGKRPWRSEPVLGSVTFANDAPSLRISTLDGEGNTRDVRALAGSGGTFTITLSARDRSHWFVIEP